MVVAPFILLAVLLILVFGANSMKKKGALTEAAYQMVISVSAIAVTVAALGVMFARMRNR